MAILEIEEAAIIAGAQEKLLELSFRISGVINLARVSEDIVQARNILAFLNVLQNPTSLLTYSERQQVIMALIALAEL